MVAATTEQIVHLYGYMPMVAPNAVGLALSSILLILQTVFGIYYRQWWMFVTWFIGIAFTVVGYAIRVSAKYVPYNDQTYKVQYAFFIIVPAFIMAGVYFQMSKLLTIWGLHFAKFKPMFYTGIFIGCDVVSILVQAAGGGTAVSNDYHTANIGRWIIEGGIAFQVVSMAVFLIFFLKLIWTVSRASESEMDPRHADVRHRPLFKFLVPAVLICWCFVYARSIYRLIELAQGWRGYLAVHEVYFLVLEGLMMILAMATLTIMFPGFAYGREIIPVQGLHRKKHWQQDNSDEKVLADSF